MWPASGPRLSSLFQKWLWVHVQAKTGASRNCSVEQDDPQLLIMARCMHYSWTKLLKIRLRKGEIVFVSESPGFLSEKKKKGGHWAEQFDQIYSVLWVIVYESNKSGVANSGPVKDISAQSNHLNTDFPLLFGTWCTEIKRLNLLLQMCHQCKNSFT